LDELTVALAEFCDMAVAVQEESVVVEEVPIDSPVAAILEFVPHQLLVLEESAVSCDKVETPLLVLSIPGVELAATDSQDVAI
jgi:hypothetical protein